MESLSGIRFKQQPLKLHSTLHRRALFRSSFSIQNSSSSSWSWPSRLMLPIRASFNSISPNPRTLKTPFLETLFKSTSTAVAIAAAALFIAHTATHKPAFANPIPTITSNELVVEKEREASLEDYLEVRPFDAYALRSLLEFKLKAQKFPEAIGILDRLTKIEDDEPLWPLLSAHVHAYNDEPELARIGFNEVISKYPLLSDAYHGLMMVEMNGGNLDDVMERVEDAMKRCRDRSAWATRREFKLLIAQMKLVQGDHDDALKDYEELAEEEPQDFRPYLCQGIIYALSRKQDEADEQFHKYKELVPKGDVCAQDFVFNMIKTSGLSEMGENMGAC